MATQDSVMGLFTDPQQYQQALLQQQMKQNYDIAQLTPEQQVTGGLRTAGYQLGGGIGGLMGVEDPQMKLQTLRQQVLQGLDRTDPNSLMQGVRQLMQAGDTRGANDLQTLAQETALKQSQITKNLREGNAAMLTTEQRNFAQAQKDGYTGTFNQWLTEQNTSKAARSTVNVPLDRVFDKFFTQKTAEEQAKNWDLYGQAFSTIPQTREKLAEVRSLIDQSFSGAGGNVKLGAAKLARSLNLPIDVNKASNTEIVEALTTQFAISELKKNFGSNPAVKDFEAQLKVKPGILQEPETFKKLVDKLDQGLQAEELSYRQGEQYRKNNKGSIEGFNPYTARADANAKLIRLSALVKKHQEGKMTPAEQAEATKLQGELNAAK